MKNITHPLLLAFTLTVTNLSAAPEQAKDFVQASTQAATGAKPFAVFVHGSSWHPASKTLREKIWQNRSFQNALKQPIILTQIHVRQHPDEDAAKAAAAAQKGWNVKSVSTYPAIQIFAPDGHFLKSIQGRELRSITSPASLAEHIDHIAALSNKRDTLKKKIQQARKEKDTTAELKLLCALIELPIKNESKITDQLKKIDPKDTSGWQARLSFRNWEYLRHVTKLIGEKKAETALKETEAMLSSGHYTDTQKILLLGAKGKILIAMGDLPAAWKSFQKAHAIEPTHPNSIAMLRYGVRTAGVPLRATVSLGSTLSDKKIGTNISRDHATFTPSSDSGNGSDHSALFKGPHTPKGFAFHTKSEKGAHIVINLHADCLVRALQITNRPRNKHAAKLTLWHSMDNKTWTKAWQAPANANAWDVYFKQPIKTRYIKLGLPAETANYFHLRAVDIFGERPSASK